ncbi:hypothetical protein HK096_006069 [Nowakowskiella sp. JEL0078]|nr:hypothetical protein HK096_006069 [Nowakowskiella sp. JEL0078]
MISPEAGPSIHSFTAASDFVVVLDLIGPPYNDDRPCTYYRKLDYIPHAQRIQYSVPSPPATDESANSETNSPPKSNSKGKKKKKKPKNINFDFSQSNSHNQETKNGKSIVSLFDSLPSSPSNEHINPSYSLDTQIDESEGLCLLEIAPNMNYECDERPYKGQAVRGSDLIAMGSTKI